MTPGDFDACEDPYCSVLAQLIAIRPIANLTSEGDSTDMMQVLFEKLVSNLAVPEVPKLLIVKVGNILLHMCVHDRWPPPPKPSWQRADFSSLGQLVDRRNSPRTTKVNEVHVIIST